MRMARRASASASVSLPSTPGRATTRVSPATAVTCSPTATGGWLTAFTWVSSPGVRLHGRRLPGKGLGHEGRADGDVAGGADGRGGARGRAHEGDQAVGRDVAGDAAVGVDAADAVGVGLEGGPVLLDALL